jgi:hypothetical protein
MAPREKRQSNADGKTETQKVSASAREGQPSASGTTTAPRRASTLEMPRIDSASELLGMTTSASLTTVQKSLQGSNFQDAAHMHKRNQVIGLKPTISSVELVAVADREFDGVKAAPELTSRDSWKALQAPLQNVEGKRSKAVYEQVLKQFAVQSNPRYVAEGLGNPRAHIFVWDVSRAMHCEVPHFVGAKELSLGQTCDWIRHEGPMRGWHRISESDVLERLDLGHMVICLPKDIRAKAVAIVHPQAMPADGVLKVCGVGATRGWGLTPQALMGVRVVEYVAHA